MEELKVGDWVTHPGGDFVMRITHLGRREYKSDPALWATCEWDDGTEGHSRDFKLSVLKKAPGQPGPKN